MKPTLNTTAMGIVRDYAMYRHFADIKNACFAILKALQNYNLADDVPFITHKVRIMWSEIYDYVRQIRTGFAVESEATYRISER